MSPVFARVADVLPGRINRVSSGSMCTLSRGATSGAVFTLTDRLPAGVPQCTAVLHQQTGRSTPGWGLADSRDRQNRLAVVARAGAGPTLQFFEFVEFV